MKIEHVALYVHDLEGARTFFMKYLGAKSNGGYHNPRTDFRSYFLSFDGGARLELMHKPKDKNTPTQRFSGAFNVGANVLDGLILTWKLYRMFGGKQSSGPFNKFSLFKKKKK